MELLQAGVDRSVIALWLGHESIETTQIYLDADLALSGFLAKSSAQKGSVEIEDSTAPGLPHFGRTAKGLFYFKPASELLGIFATT